MQQEKTYTVNKVPFLGDIPGLGLLFQSKTDTLQNTELVIYIVPHVEYPELRVLDAPRRLESLYERYVKAQ
jgi:type II secretory pathway component GspD/PulD (secretin)